MGIDDETRRYLLTCCEELPTTPPNTRVVHGFDGYVDRVRILVESRSNKDKFRHITSLSALEERIGKSVALNNSCSIEWKERARRAGGHTSHLGRAFSTLGFNAATIGTYGSPPKTIFEQELADCSIFSIGSPSYSDAIEFNDGKLMLNEIGSMASLDWDMLCERVGQKKLADAIDGAAVLSMGYWSTIPSMPGIWDGLRKDLWPSLSDPPETVFVDPADVRRMSEDRLREGIEPLKQLDRVVPVTFSTNRLETEVVASLEDEEVRDDDFKTITRRAKNALGVSRYLAHTVDRSIVVSDVVEATARPPHVEKPELTASAGDHFNAGFILGDILGLPDSASLMLGNAVANWFLRHGFPPDYDELLDFLDKFDTLFE